MRRKPDEMQETGKKPKKPATITPRPEVLPVTCNLSSEEALEIYEREKIKQYRSEAAQGSAEGWYKLGVAYAQGKGIPLDKEEPAARMAIALSCYQKAAEKGDSLACYVLSCIYEEGVLVKKDMEESKRWRAAVTEHKDPLFRERFFYYAGMSHELGLGGQKNLAKAEKYYNSIKDNAPFAPEASYRLQAIKHQQQNHTPIPASSPVSPTPLLARVSPNPDRIAPSIAGNGCGI